METIEGISQANQKWNWLNLLIYGLWALLSFIICAYIYSWWPNQKIDNNILFLISLLFILSLSHVFNHFSIGKLIEVSRQKNEMKEKFKEISSENKELRLQLLSNFQTSTQELRNNINPTFNIHPQKVVDEESKPDSGVKDKEEETPKQEPKSNEGTKGKEENQIDKASLGSRKTIPLRNNLTDKLLQNQNWLPTKRLVNAHLVPTDKYEDSLSLYPVFDAVLTIEETSIFVEYVVDLYYNITRIKYLAKTVYDQRVLNQKAVLYIVLCREYLKENGDRVKEHISKKFSKCMEINLIKILEI